MRERRLNVDSEAAFDLAADATGDDFVLRPSSFFQLIPHQGALGFFAGENGFAEAVFKIFQSYFDGVADFYVDVASFGTELFDRQ